MIESRCGLTCSKCEYFVKGDCRGCIVIDKPFWSDSCDVKSCCEEKGYDFCGQCPDFPCATLISMAGDDVHKNSRIGQCKIWIEQMKD